MSTLTNKKKYISLQNQGTLFADQMQKFVSTLQKWSTVISLMMSFTVQQTPQVPVNILSFDPTRT